MSKRMKALIAVVAAILVLTVGGTAVVMAQDEPTPTPETGANGLLPRVAEILGISQEELTSAFKQAQQEMRQEALLRFLERAVAEERITEGEAQQILEWWELRPEVLGPGLSARTFGFPALPGGHMWGGHRGWCWPKPPELAQ